MFICFGRFCIRCTPKRLCKLKVCGAQTEEIDRKNFWICQRFCLTDPKQRLALMRRLEHPQLVQPPTRNVVPRTEYFKGDLAAYDQMSTCNDVVFALIGFVH